MLSCIEGNHISTSTLDYKKLPFQRVTPQSHQTGHCLQTYWQQRQNVWSKMIFLYDETLKVDTDHYDMESKQSLVFIQTNSFSDMLNLFNIACLNVKAFVEFNHPTPILHQLMRTYRTPIILFTNYRTRKLFLHHNSLCMHKGTTQPSLFWARMVLGQCLSSNLLLV